MFEDYTSVSLTNTRFITNEANYGGGGTMRTNSYFSCNNCTFDGNIASSYGGGVYV